MAGIVGILSRSIPLATHSIKSILQLTSSPIKAWSQLSKSCLSQSTTSVIPLRKYSGLLTNSQLLNPNTKFSSIQNYHLLATQNLQKPDILCTSQVTHEQCRTVTKFSLNKGRRKSVKAVRLRFFRLDNGLWIHTLMGRHKHLWKKTNETKKMYKSHIVASKANCKMFEKMVQGYWKKKKYYIDDPYEPYHVRNNFPWAPFPKNKTTS